MKIKLLGKNLNDVRPRLTQIHLTECSDTEIPELIVTHGGDGALLGAERDYPGVPKLPLRDARTAPLCEVHEQFQTLTEFAAGNLQLFHLPKVAGEHHSGRQLALNDVFLHNFDRGSALRYRVYIDGKLYAKEIVGDGVGIASVHGSTAYYRSITHSIFRVGIGLAFSNSTEEVNHLVLSPEARIRIEILRGPGLLIADNSPLQQEIPEGDCVEFYQSDNFARIYGLDAFMCPLCRALRHTNKLYGKCQ